MHVIRLSVVSVSKGASISVGQILALLGVNTQLRKGPVIHQSVQVMTATHSHTHPRFNGQVSNASNNM